MINIISRAVESDRVSGPQKVVNNLIKGLNLINYPYCINKELDTTSQLWIHDDPYALKKASRLKLQAIAGPNIYLMPRNIPAKLDLSKCVYIHPSKWAADFWGNFGYDKYPLDYWPTGIDVKEFKEQKKNEQGIVLIYYKQRYTEELNHLESLLKLKSIEYKVICYGYYKQKDYQEALKNTRYLVWLGRQESQGIALQEALATNVPMLVWDVQTMGQWIPTKKESTFFTEDELKYPATSAAYFDARCGLITKNKENVSGFLDQMEKEWRNYTPRLYIEENLSLEKQATEFVKLFEKNFGISFESGKNEKIRGSRKWQNAKWYYKIYFKVKDSAKNTLAHLKSNMQ